MMIALERLGEYKKDRNRYLEEHIGVMYDKLWNFHVTINENYELSVEQKMGIVLDSFPDSWDYEKKALIERMSKLSYKNIVTKLNKQLEYRI